MNYQKIDDNLYLIKLDQKPEGYRDFISSWVYSDGTFSFLVDPGPLYSIDILKKSLDEIGIKSLDYILLTHIHIDHAGGTGKLLGYFPGAKVLCHPKGFEHMINPEKLWKGSLAVLGDTAKAYGEIVPVPEKSLFFEEKIGQGGITVEVIDTPGHAAHHFSYLFGKYLFAGEVAGVHAPLEGRIYTRPATPPKFILEVWQTSLERVIARKPEIICYGHYGFRNDAAQAMVSAGEQMVLWTEVVRGLLKSGEDNLVERAREALLEKDRLYANYKYLDNDIKKREHDFLKNSIRGISEYVKAVPG
ncbi:MAG: MBL fold metallo-hydrolase [Spirochaetes bacterium]|nr:MBL fold metallo-hydrolase [Spirochaetota bacterium]